MPATAVVDIAPGDTEIDAELNDVAGHLNAQHGRLVDLTVRLLAEPMLWQGDGVWTIEQYLAWRVGVAPSRASQIADIARRADELPRCLDALRRGELSVDQVAPIAKRAPWWTDSQISTLARNLTVTQVRRVVSKYPFPDIPDPDAVEESDLSPAADSESGEDEGEILVDGESCENGGVDRRSIPDDVCSFHTGDDDRFRLHLETDALTGELIATALTEARDRLFHGGQSGVGWVDAMREVAESSLGNISGTARRDRHRIHLHLDAAGTATDRLGWTVPDAIRQHLCCDGLITPTWTDGGVPVSVGRTRHIVPERTRRLVVHRDHGCRMPGCSHDRFLEIHHIIHWLDDGPTDTWNLVALCPRHHRLHHRGVLGISGNADQAYGLVFTSATGERITNSGARPKPPGASPPPPDGTYEHPIGGRLESRWLYFYPPPGHRT